MPEMDDTTNPMAGNPPDDPHERQGERLSESAWDAIDAAMARLEEAWREGATPDIGALVPANADPATQRSVLTQLVGIDLEWRWKTAATTVDRLPRGAEAADAQTLQYQRLPVNLLPRQPRLVDYAARYPVLGPVEQFPVDLVVGEYYARRRYGDQPAHEEYLEMFGRLHPDLAQRLQAVDDEIASADRRTLDRADEEPRWSGPHRLQHSERRQDKDGGLVNPPVRWDR